MAPNKSKPPERAACLDAVEPRALLRLWNRSTGWRRRLGLGSFLLLRRRQNRVQNRPLLARHELLDPRLANVLDLPGDDRVAQFAVGHLPAAEAKAGLHLVPIDKEPHRLVLLGLVIVFVHGH